MKKNEGRSGSNAEGKRKLPGDPVYEASEDIYAREERETFSDEEIPITEEEEKSEVPLDENLDVPGADLDDEDERIGEEDEENNYYSLGGDDHNDLDETEEE